MPRSSRRRFQLLATSIGLALGGMLMSGGSALGQGGPATDVVPEIPPGERVTFSSAAGAPSSVGPVRATRRYRMADDSVRPQVDSEGYLEDTIGDNFPLANALWAPDILVSSVFFFDSGIGRVDDDVLFFAALTNNSRTPLAATSAPNTRLDATVCGDDADFYCDFDSIQVNIDITGDDDLEAIAQIIGTPSGNPALAILDVWNPTSGRYDRSITAATLDLDGWNVRISRAALGVARGGRVRVQTLSERYTRANSFQSPQLRQQDAAPNFATDGSAVLAGFDIPGDPAPPAIGVGASVGVSESGFTATGTVDPLGAATTYYVRYGVGSATEKSTSVVSAGEGVGATGVQVAIGGLAYSTTYQYQLVAKSVWGEVAGPVQTVTTLPIAAAAFRVSTEPARPVGLSSAQVTGVFDPLSSTATYYWRWGTRPGNLTNQTPRQSAAPGSGFGARGATIERLKSGTRYYYQLMVEVDGKTIPGLERDFTTLTVPQLTFVPSLNADGFGRFTRFGVRELTLRQGSTVLSPGKGVRVQVRCLNGCFARRTFTPRGSRELSYNLLPHFRSVRGRPGVTIEIRVTRPGAIGRVVRYRFFRHRNGNLGLVSQNQRCLFTVNGPPRACPKR